ncbi:hypothetical protein GGR53DRAFT_126777 [Hypoxylon sp. FL1150]|nr:hypothetical protein GGR53DRAFT_126777 [Hypoxylon sp. FL1150]
MDPSAMDFVMHQSDPSGSMSMPAVDPRTRGSRCPAFRMSEQQHHHPMPSFRANYQFDPSHNPHNFWQTLPPPQRWIPDPAYQPSPPVMPPNSGQIGQPPYTSSSGPTYNPLPHPTPPFDYRQPMLNLQRIGATAPIPHSQGSFSVPANQGGQNVQVQPQAGQTSGGGFTTNGTLPPLNPMIPNANHTRHLPFNQNSRPAQHSGRTSPPPFVRQTSIPSTNISAPDIQTSSRLSDTDNSQSDSPSPHRSTMADAGNEDTTAESRQTSANRDRRVFPRLPSSESGWSSDDDSDRDAIALSLLEAAASSAPGTEDRMRAHQIMRGAVSNKRVASKKALTSLETVAISDLAQSEKTCVICYNDYGVETPEGISETPLRLPKCKHVFGDHCIKKWFEESDSCPYCRDKVPSEPQYRQIVATTNMYRFIRQQQLRTMERERDRERDRGESDSPPRPSATRLSGGSLEEYHASLVAVASPYLADFGYVSGSPAYRRSEGSSSRIWHGSSAERHSPLPFTEGNSETRRRTRSHRGSLRFPPGRPHPAAAQAGSPPQPQHYPWVPSRQPQPQPQPHSHSHRHSSSASSAGAGAGIRTMADAGHFQQLGPPESYLNPLNMGNSGTADEHQNHNLPQMRPQYASPLSPTYAGPEVYMPNADDPVFGGPGTHSSM